jgi:hypothetical protein
VTIRRGEDWGEVGELGADDPVVGTDAALSAWVHERLAGGAASGPVGLTGGDLHRTLGAPTRPEGLVPGAPLLVVECDVIELSSSGGVHHAVAHVVGTAPGPHARWAGPTFVAMNAAFVGAANLGPRAHPGDGLLDVTVGELPWRQRRAAARRETTGTHVPHPALTERRARQWSPDADVSWSLTVDGVALGSHRAVSLRILPGALTVVV